MLPLNVIAAVILVIVAALQSTYADRAFVRRRSFRVFAMVVSVVSALLMGVTAFRESGAQERLQAAVEGMSKTVFPQDVHFDLAATMRPGADGRINVNVFAITKESPLFRRWPVTHTPNDFGLGAILTHEPLDFSGLDLIALIAAPGADYFAFGAEIEQRTEFSVRLEPTIVPREYRTLDDFRECQFVCVVTGDLAELTRSELVLKGMRVPFYTVRREPDWIGTTVFRPTYDRYFR